MSNRLEFSGGDDAKLRDLRLPLLGNLSDLAMALGITNEAVIWLSFEPGASGQDHYRRYEIPKRSGGMRLISSPRPRLRQAQLWVKQSILDQLPVSPHAYAFCAGRSIVDNAERHVGAGIVVKMDVRDFFPSITFIRVRGFFESVGYNPGVATVLALLCTDAPRKRVTIGGERQIVAVGERSLPQGASTSPVMSNLIAKRLDARLQGWCARRGFTYSRYADDLTFSTSAADTGIGGLLGFAGRVLREEGFEPHDGKLRIMRNPRRQIVTGLLVNESVRLPKSDIKRMRAFLHRCETRGIEAVSMELGKDARAVAQGYLAYMHMVDHRLAEVYRAKHPWAIG